MTVRKAARNALCPCGSGKKLKRCCALAGHERDRRAAEQELRPHADGVWAPRHRRRRNPFAVLLAMASLCPPTR